MRAIHITKSGGPEVLQLQETPKPTPAENQVLSLENITFPNLISTINI